MDGWIKLHRKIADNWLWADKPFSKGQAWIDLLLLANHDDKKVLRGSTLVDCKRGTHITSILKLSTRWGWSRKKVSSFLDVLENEKMLEQKRTTNDTTITIVKYSDFQDKGTTKEQQKNSRGTTKEQQKNTNKNVKNDKNVKNISNRGFTPPTLENVIGYCQERANKVDPNKFFDFYTSKGWMVGKNKMKDWKAAVRNWERSDKVSSKPNQFTNFSQTKMDSELDLLDQILQEEING